MSSQKPFFGYDDQEEIGTSCQEILLGRIFFPFLNMIISLSRKFQTTKLVKQNPFESHTSQQRNTPEEMLFCRVAIITVQVLLIRITGELKKQRNIKSEKITCSHSIISVSNAHSNQSDVIIWFLVYSELSRENGSNKCKVESDNLHSVRTTTTQYSISIISLILVHPVLCCDCQWMLRIGILRTNNWPLPLK